MNRAELYVDNILKYPTKYEARKALGYSESYCLSGHIDQTARVKKAMSNILEKLEKERDRLVESMSGKDLDKVQYKDAATSLDKIQKQIQLLTGEDTERQGVTINITSYGDKRSV